MKGLDLHLVFTDLDGTLLDHADYGYTGSIRGMEILKERGIPLILVSSKTFPEMTALNSELDLRTPLIFENGGGIAYPEIRGGSGDFRLELPGYSVQELRVRLPLLEQLMGTALKTIFEMTMDEITARTGLTPGKALLAMERKTSIPFILPSGKQFGLKELGDINRKLRSHKLTMTRGDRFYHISSQGANKGDAIHRVTAFFKKSTGIRKIITMGIGDSENDIPMLKSVTHPFLVRKHDGSFIETGLNIKVTRGIGPEGFTEAIEELFGKTAGPGA